MKVLLNRYIVQYSWMLRNKDSGTEMTELNLYILK